MIEKRDLETLKTSLRGELLQPADSGYDEGRSVWNGMIDRRPTLIARCQGVADLAACVNFARTHNLPLSIKSGVIIFPDSLWAKER